MLIAVISDTHMPRGARRLPDACVERIAAADLLLHAGDFSTLEVLRELEAIGPPVVGVHGNVDSADCAGCCPPSASWRRGRPDRDGPRRRPARRRLERMRRRFGERADVVVFGHSHLPLHEQAPDGFQILNPGSPTERRRAPAHTMGLIRVEERLGRCELDRFDTVYGIMTPGELIKERRSARPQPAPARASGGHQPERDRPHRERRRGRHLEAAAALLLAMGEEPVLGSKPLRAATTPGTCCEQRRMSPSRGSQSGLAFNEFGSELARRARRRDAVRLSSSMPAILRVPRRARGGLRRGRRRRGQAHGYMRGTATSTSSRGPIS